MSTAEKRPWLYSPLNTVPMTTSKGFDGRDEVKLEQLSPVLAEQGRSAALIRGVAAGIAKQGGVLGGFDAYTTSDLFL